MSSSLHRQTSGKLAKETSGNPHGIEKISINSIDKLFSIFHDFRYGDELAYDVNAIPIDKKLGNNAQQHMNEIIENINLAKDIAKQNIEQQQEKSKERFDQKTKIPDFKLFDKVLIKSHKVPVGLSPKLVKKYHGPYYISEIGPNFTYKIRDCKDRK